jgi:hypothetical protein
MPLNIAQPGYCALEHFPKKTAFSAAKDGGAKLPHPRHRPPKYPRLDSNQ